MYIKGCSTLHYLSTRPVHPNTQLLKKIDVRLCDFKYHVLYFRFGIKIMVSLASRGVPLLRFVLENIFHFGLWNMHYESDDMIYEKQIPLIEYSNSSNFLSSLFDSFKILRGQASNIFQLFFISGRSNTSRASNIP